MKKSLLFATALLCVCVVDAQQRPNFQAKAIPTKKFSGVSKHTNGKPAAAACDTLKLDSANNYWSPYYYTYGTKGYVLGVSNINDAASLFLDTIKEDANYYDISGTGYNYITGGLVFFAKANSNKASELTKNLVFKVYDDDGTGEPGTLLGSTTLALSQVNNDVADSSLTEFTFATPIALPSNKIFYVSIDHSNFVWKSTIKDSIAIIADSSDQAPAAAYQYLDGLSYTGWVPVNQFWSSGTDTNGNAIPLDVNLFLFPYVSTNADGSCAVLPVNIFGFKGSVVNNQAVLTWNTAVELNNKGFEVERSKDGKTFTDIGFVNGAGTSTQAKKYSYTDATLKELNVTTSYYRLKQIDADGKASYSNVIPLSIKDGLTWRLYPNPVRDKFTLELNLTTDSKVNVQVISKDGKVVVNADKGLLTQGVQQISLNIQNISAGSYFIRIKAGDKYYTQTIIKQ